MAASRDMLDRKKIDKARPKLGLIDFLIKRDQERGKEIIAPSFC